MSLLDSERASERVACAPAPKRHLRVIQGGVSVDEPAEVSFQAGRGRGRPREVRAQTLGIRTLKRAIAEHGAIDFEYASAERPRTRADCERGPRPCPWTSCAHHLYLDVMPNGSLKLNFPDLEPHELKDSCVLDVADRNGQTLKEVGVAMSLTRERVRQLEVKAIRKVRVAIERDNDDVAETFVDTVRGGSIDSKVLADDSWDAVLRELGL